MSEPADPPSSTPKPVVDSPGGMRTRTKVMIGAGAFLGVGAIAALFLRRR